MRTYILMVRGNDPVVPAWDVMASTTDYNRASEQYRAIDTQKCMLLWTLMEGVKVLRANFKNINFSDGMNDIDIPFMALPKSESTAMFVPIRRAVGELMKG